jgi:tyrosinase
MFVYYFEEIVREVVKPEPFNLPYWNYSTPVPSLHGIMPPEFRVPNNPTTNSLYRTNRNPGPNAGQPIDKTDPGALDLTALQQTTYSPQGAAPGFCQDLDFGLHGNVHVLIGNSQGMGSVPWAAYDPIFWMHHCNIDRLWASWNRNGGKNPTLPSFRDQQFIFADKTGKKVTGTVKNFLDIASLGYTYEHFEPKPPGFVPAALTPELTAGVQSRVMASAAASAGGVVLGAGPVRVNLEPSAEPQGAVGTLDEGIKALEPSKKLYVVLKGLHAEVQPEVLYHVYLNLPENVTPDNGGAHYVGTINFFDATGHGDHGGAAPAQGTPKFYGLNATTVAKSLQTQGLLKTTPSLTIVPSGTPVGEAKPVIGEVSLVAQ